MLFSPVYEINVLFDIVHIDIISDPILSSQYYSFFSQMISRDRDALSNW